MIQGEARQPRCCPCDRRHAVGHAVLGPSILRCGRGQGSLPQKGVFQLRQDGKGTELQAEGTAYARTLWLEGSSAREHLRGCCG